MIFLDSNVLIDFVRGRRTVREGYHHAEQQGLTLLLSVIVLEELELGVHRAASPDKERALLAPLLRDTAVIPFEQPDALLAARLQAQLWRAGVKPSYADLLIGAHALSRGCPLVTANTRHFQNIPGLKLLDWTQPPPEQDTLDA